MLIAGSRSLLRIGGHGPDARSACGDLQAAGEHLPQAADPDAALAAFQPLFVRGPQSARLGGAARARSVGHADAAGRAVARAALGRAIDCRSRRPSICSGRRQGSRSIGRRCWAMCWRKSQPSRTSGRSSARSRASHTRHLLRIAYGEIVCRQRLELVLEQLSHLAEALIEAAFAAARASHSRNAAIAADAEPSQSADSNRAYSRSGSSAAVRLSYAGPVELLVLYSAAPSDQQRPACGTRAFRSRSQAVRSAVQRSRKEPNRTGKCGSCHCPTARFPPRRMRPRTSLSASTASAAPGIGRQCSRPVRWPAI